MVDIVWEKIESDINLHRKLFYTINMIKGNSRILPTYILWASNNLSVEETEFIINCEIYQHMYYNLSVINYMYYNCGM